MSNIYVLYLYPFFFLHVKIRNYITEMSSNSSRIVLVVQILKQDAQLSQRDRAAECVSFGQKWKTGTGRQYFTVIIGLSMYLYLLTVTH